MEWKNLFSDVILKRGKSYYRQGLVQGLDQTEAQIFHAWVEGTEDYEVSVDLSGKRPVMDCTCPYADEHRYCKHMAAVLYEIEAKGLYPGMTQKTGRYSVNEKSDIFDIPHPIAGGSGHHPITDSSNRHPIAGNTSVARPESSSQTGLPKQQVYPFGQDPDLLWQIGAEDRPEYRYFELGRITKNLTFYDTDLKKAQELLQRERITLSGVDTLYDSLLDSHNLVGKAAGFCEQRGLRHPVGIWFNREKILKEECQVPGCPACRSGYSLMHVPVSWRENVRELCVHQLALLLLAEDTLKKQNPGDITDRAGDQMLAAFRSRRSRKRALQAKPVEAASLILEPRLTREWNRLTLAFRAGTDKLYVIKDLTLFVECVEQKKQLELGTQVKLDMSIHTISEACLPWYEFLKTVVLTEESRKRYSQNSGVRGNDLSEPIHASIVLYGYRLDEFFAISMGKRMELTDKTAAGQKRNIRFRESDPQINLDITPETEEGTFVGITAEGSMPDLIQGEENLYFFSNHHMNRIPSESMDKLRPLTKMAEQDGKIRFHVGRKNLSEFYYRVLPVLEDCVTLQEEEAEKIRQALPPEVAFRFYLDAEGQNVFCRPTAVYRENEYDLMAPAENADADFRDVPMEQEAAEIVRRWFPQQDKNGTCHCGSNQDRIYDLLEKGLGELMEYGEVRSTERFRHIRIRKKSHFSVGVSVESDILNLEILSDDLNKEELLEIFEQCRLKKHYYRLKNGDFLDLEQENIAELSAMLDALRITPKEFTDGKMHLPQYRALYLDRMLEENESIYWNRDSKFRSLVKEFKTVKDSDFEVPKTLRNVLRPYQIYGYKWLRTLEQGRFGGILADDMGLGKTLQVITVLLENAQQSVSREQSLIVCPASLVYNWEEELRRFAPSLSVMTIAGNQQERKDKLLACSGQDVLITSYDLLKRDIAEYEDLYFRYQIIDEAQYIKNHNTEAAKSVKVIHSRTRFALTGTPIENRLSELWSIFDYLMPGFLYSYEEFRRDYETPITKFQDSDAARQLRRMVSPFILRRLKKDVLKDLPEKLEEVQYAHMEETQQRIYDSQVAHMQEMLESESGADFASSKIQILAELTRIRQICCDPSLILENYGGESAKRQTCMDLIRSAIEGEHKMLVFSQFTSMLELLEQDLRKAGISYYKIIGSTPKERRLELVEMFNEDTTPVFLISLKAGGTGLNLTGADIVIHYDPWWNLAAQNQATDRAHRIGQTKKVTVYKLILKGTVEEKIMQMQEDKQNLADEILNAEGTSLGRLSKDQLLELLEG